MQIKLANPRGFCAGVDRAIEIVTRALEVFGPPIYVRHEVVHNKVVVEDLRNRGAVFVDELHEIPDDVIVIFSAHGVSKAVQDEAEARNLKVFDHELVGDHFMAHVDRWAEHFQCAGDGFDSPVDAGTEAARIGQFDLHGEPRILVS